MADAAASSAVVAPSSEPPAGGAGAAAPAARDAERDGMLEFLRQVVLDVVADVADPHATAAVRLTTLPSLEELVGDPERAFVHRDTKEVRGMPVSLWHLRMQQQPTATGRCGYYSLFNAMVVDHYARLSLFGVKAEVGSGDAVTGRPEAVSSPLPVVLRRKAHESAGPTSGGGILPSAAEGGGASAPEVPSTVAADDAEHRESRERPGAGLGPLAGELRRRLHCRSDFWRFFRDARGVLAEFGKSKAARAEESLWSVEALDSECLERSHLSVLLSSAGRPVLGSFGSRVSVLREFGLASLKVNSVSEEALEVLERVARDCQHSDRWVHSFMVGLSNHWISLVAIKRPRPSDGRPELIVCVCDSMNSDIHGRRDREVKHMIANFDFREDPYLPLEWIVIACLETTRGAQFVAGLLAAILSGAVKPTEELFRLSADGFLRNFPATVWRPRIPDPSDTLRYLFDPSARPQPRADRAKYLSFFPEDEEILSPTPSPPADPKEAAGTGAGARAGAEHPAGASFLSPFAEDAVEDSLAARVEGLDNDVSPVVFAPPSPAEAADDRVVASPTPTVSSRPRVHHDPLEYVSSAPAGAPVVEPRASASASASSGTAATSAGDDDVAAPPSAGPPRPLDAAAGYTRVLEWATSYQPVVLTERWVRRVFSKRHTSMLTTAYLQEAWRWARTVQRLVRARAGVLLGEALLRPDVSRSTLAEVGEAVALVASETDALWGDRDGPFLPALRRSAVDSLPWPRLFARAAFPRNEADMVYLASVVENMMKAIDQELAARSLPSPGEPAESDNPREVEPAPVEDARTCVIA